MKSNVLESARKYLNDNLCIECRNYFICHQGKKDDMIDCKYMTIYLAGYSDAVNYFNKSLIFTKINGIKHQNEIGE